jgi:hypothetical protein
MSEACGSLVAMFALRSVPLFVSLFALAVAGCANTGDQGPQTSAGEVLPRPKTVLIYDFEFSSDVAVVDREFTTRLERDIGNLSVSNQLVAKRVNAEIVATIITILHDEAGLNGRPGIDDDPALKDAALVVTGQLQAADRGTRAQRTPVNFGGGVVADIMVSRVSEGAKTQLLTFTTQAQKGAAFTGPAAAAHIAAIKAVLAGESVPTQNLSPDVEAQARGLGRAVADKINAYAMQQGWVNKADLPARPVDTKPAKNKPQKLLVAAAKQGGSTPPPNTIPCNAFTKNERGNWYVKGPVSIDLGNAENKTLQNLEITPKFFTIGGVDLYEAVQKKCGSNQHP